MMRAILNQSLCALAVGMGALVMAATIGYTSPALLSMQEDPDVIITDNQASWIGAVVPGMALIGSLAAAPLIENYGRKYILTAVCLPYLLGWALICFSANPNGVIMARTLCGFCLGLQRVAMSVFMSESVHVAIRSSLMAIPQFLSTAGFLLIMVSGKFLDWRGMGWIGVSVLLPMFLLLLYLPETPYYLLKKGEKEKSLRTLKWLRETTDAAQSEHADLTKSLSQVNENNSFTVRSLLSQPYRTGFLVAILLHIFQQLTGLSAVLSFMNLIFQRSGSSVDPRTCSVILTSLNFIIVFVAAYMFQKYPRKRFLKFSSMQMAGSLLVLAAYVRARESEGAVLYIAEHLGFIPLLSLTSYVLGYSIGWGPLPWMFLGEGLHSKSRGVGSSLAVSTNWTFSFITTKLFNIGCEIYGLQGVFLICAMLILLGMLCMDRLMPETFKKTPIQMDEYYEDLCKKKKN